MVRNYTFAFFLVLIAAFTISAQNDLGFRYENGKMVPYDTKEPFTRFLTPFTKAVVSNSTDKITSNTMNLLFEEDSTDAFLPGINAYFYGPSFSAFDEGNGKKMFITSITDTGAGVIKTKYYSSSNYQPLSTIVDGQFKNPEYRTETANIQMTGDSHPEHICMYVEKGGSPCDYGTTVMRIKNTPLGNTIFDGKFLPERQGYYVADQYLKGLPDLTGDGLYEFMSVRSHGFGSGATIYMYNDLALKDSVDDLRFGLFIYYSTSNDINSDGIPEITCSVDGSVNFYQWNSTANKLQLLGNLPERQSLYRSPVKIDGESTKKIFTHGGLLGDTLYIHNPDFSLKYQIKVPGIGVIRYFFANVNSSPNDELIVVTELMHPSIFFTNGTAVYDLSVSTTDPIFVDTTFEAQGVGNYKNDGTNYLVGIRTLPYQPKPGFWAKRFEVNKVVNSKLQQVSTAADTDYFYQSIAGPFEPSETATVGMAFGFSPMPNITKADFTGNGKQGFLLLRMNKALQYNYSLVDIDGQTIDSLNGVVQSSLGLSADFNNNGKDELLITQTKPFIQIGPFVPRTYMFEYNGVADVKDNTEQPNSFNLSQNYPNPFNPSTTIKYSVPQQGLTKLKIFDMLGREVSTLVNEVQSAGTHQVNFNASGLSSGVYVYSLESGNYRAQKKLIFLK